MKIIFIIIIWIVFARLFMWLGKKIWTDEFYD